MRRSLVLACLLALVAACSQSRTGSVAQSLTVTFARNGAPSGQTTVALVPGQPSGDIAVSLDGVSYSGRWTYVASTGPAFDPAASLGPGQSAGPGQSSNALATIPISASGNIVLSGATGASLRCVFDYSAGSSAGSGKCRDDKGGEYDLEIRR